MLKNMVNEEQGSCPPPLPPHTHARAHALFGHASFLFFVYYIKGDLFPITNNAETQFTGLSIQHIFDVHVYNELFECCQSTLSKHKDHAP